MGTDIWGWIEIHTTDYGLDGKDEERWIAALNLDHIYTGRDYDAFGCLFGVRNLAGFRPLADHRGLPADVSARAGADCAELGGHSPSWLLWSELAAVDWDEPAEEVDARVRRYRRLPDGTLRYEGKAGWDRRFEELAGSGRGPGDPPTAWPEGTEWIGDDAVYRVERMRRRDAAGPDTEWGRVWAVMAALAAVHGPEHVRLTVWFDS